MPNATNPPSDADWAATVHQLQAELATCRESQRTLEQKLDNNRAFLRAIPDLVLCVGRDGRYLDYIPGAGFHTPAGEVIGKHIGDVLPPHVSEQRLHYVQRAIETGEVQIHESTLDTGEGTRHYEARTVAVDAERALTLVRDVTDTKQREEALRQAQKLKTVGMLAAGVAQDFNNLLTAIVGYADLARAPAAASPPIVEALEGIDAAVKRGQGMTKSLLALARQRVTEMGVVDLAATVRESVDMLTRLLPTTITLVTRLPDAGPRVWADASQVQQLLTNLVLNARDALPREGKIVISVSHDPLRQADAWPGLERRASGAGILTVEDSGAGMSPEVRNQMFDLFFTTKKSGRGAGLGLSIVKAIVDEHDGTIQVESTPGRGTQISVALVCDVPAHRAEAVTPRPIPARGDGELILVADDEPEVRAIVTRALEGAGYHIIEAVDGDEATRLLRQRLDAIQLAVLDVDLPKKRGSTLLSELRAQGVALPVLLISGLPTHLGTDVAGSNAKFMQKPFKLSQIRGEVRALLDRGASTTVRNSP